MKSRYRPIRLDVGFQDFLLWGSLGGWVSGREKLWEFLRPVRVKNTACR